MFISQVIFEDEKQHEDKLRNIAKHKMASIHASQGIISAECWRQEKAEKVSYAFVSKWENQDYFKAWMKASHATRPARPEGAPKVLTLKKSGFQFEEVHFENERVSCFL